MVLFDHKFRSKYRNVVRKSRAERIRCVRLREGLYFVARKSKNHGEYLVSVDATKTGLFGTCRTIRGAACPAFGVCVHLAKVYESLRAELNKREKKQEAA